MYAATIAAGRDRFELTAVGGASDSASLAAFELKAGDRLLLQPPEPRWTSSGSTPHDAAGAADREGQEGHAHARPRDRRARRAAPRRPGRSRCAPIASAARFRHFGHNAPPKYVTSTPTAAAADHRRARIRHRLRAPHLRPGTSATNTSCLARPRAPTLVPLDSEVSDLAAGHARGRADAGRATTGSDDALFAVSAIAAHRRGRRRHDRLRQPQRRRRTLLTLDEPLVRQRDVRPAPVSRRPRLPLHEVTSPPLSCSRCRARRGGAFANGTNALRFYGTADAGRARSPGGGCICRMTTAAASSWSAPTRRADFATPSPDVAKMWPLTLRPPARAVRARRLRRSRRRPSPCSATWPTHRRARPSARRCSATATTARRGRRSRCPSRR